MRGDTTDPADQIIRLLMKLRSGGITDARLLKALERVTRAAFTPPAYKDLAYEDCVLPAESGQILEKPSMLALMLQAMALPAKPDVRVLNVGAGSGYSSALLSVMGAHVFAVERLHSLVKSAEQNLSEGRYENIRINCSNGLEGWTEHAPYKNILLQGLIKNIPQTLFDQLTPDGTLIAPQKKKSGIKLVKYDAKGEKIWSQPALFYAQLKTGVSKAL